MIVVLIATTASFGINFSSAFWKLVCRLLYFWLYPKFCHADNLFTRRRLRFGQNWFFL